MYTQLSAAILFECPAIRQDGSGFHVTSITHRTLHFGSTLWLCAVLHIYLRNLGIREQKENELVGTNRGAPLRKPRLVAGCSATQ